jgi:hypothetical protein
VGDGSAAKPYATIGAALAAVVTGDTVVIGPGTFAELVQPDVTDLTIIGAGRTQTTISVLGSGPALVPGGDTANLTLRGLHIASIGSVGSNGYALVYRNILGGVTVIDCFLDADNVALFADSNVDDVLTIRDTVIRGGVKGLWAACGSTAIRMDNVTFLVNDVSETQSSIGLDAEWSDTMLLHNCMFKVAPSYVTGTIAIQVTSGRVFLDGCLISSPYDGADFGTATGIKIVNPSGHVVLSRSSVLLPGCVDLDNSGAGSLIVSGTDYTTSVGTITQMESTGSGAGAFTVTVTVTDAADDAPLENVAVRYTSGVNTYTAVTDAAGEAVFNLDDATYVVAATRAGYSFAGTTHMVAADDTLAIEMTVVTIPVPDDPGQTTAYGVTRDAQGVAEGSIAVTVELVTPRTAGQHARAEISVTSDEEDGTYEVPLLKSATYKMQRAGGPTAWKRFTTTTADTYELPVI